MLIVLLILISLIVFVSAKMVETQVQIHKGWNLIFGFVEPETLSGKLGPNSIKAIYAFIPTTQQYARVYPNPENNKIRSIDDDYMRQTSFWVYSDSETGEESNGVMNADEYMIEEMPVPLNQHQLYKGWNFLAYIPEMQRKTLEELKGSCDIEKAYIWKFDDRSDDRGWVEMPMNGKFVGDKMLMMGFVLKVSSDCTLGDSDVAPPELPGEPKINDYLILNDIGDQDYRQYHESNRTILGIDLKEYDISYYLDGGTYYSDVNIRIFNTEEDQESFWLKTFDKLESDFNLSLRDIEGVRVYESNDKVTKWAKLSIWRGEKYIISVSEPKTEGEVFEAYFDKYK